MFKENKSNIQINITFPCSDDDWAKVLMIKNIFSLQSQKDSYSEVMSNSEDEFELSEQELTELDDQLNKAIDSEETPIITGLFSTNSYKDFVIKFMSERNNVCNRLEIMQAAYGHYSDRPEHHVKRGISHAAKLLGIEKNFDMWRVVK